MAKIAVLLAEGFEEIEALTPVDYLRRAEQEVVLAAIGGSLLVKGSHNITVQADALFDGLKAADFDAVIVPGGMPGAANVAANAQAIDFIKEVFGQKKLVCAICAAPIVVLAKTGVLSQKKYTCYPGMEKELSKFCPPDEAAISMYDAALIEGKPFVVDGNVITARGPGAAEEFAMAIVGALCGEGTAQKIKQSSVQR